MLSLYVLCEDADEWRKECADSPGYETLENLIMLADKLYEARGRHSVM